MNALAELAFLDKEIEYPESDGKPMAESDFQLAVLLYAINALRTYFEQRPDVYVAGNMLLYYERGNPGAVVSPDVFVVVGAGKHQRRSYLLWREPKAPSFVLEITSKSTVQEDQGRKRGLYALLGVQEYFQFDPTADYLEPPLQGLSLRNGHYIPLPLEERADGTLVVMSDVLGLEVQLRPEEDFRFVEPATGRLLLSHKEAVSALEKAEARLAELEEQLRKMNAG